MLNAESDPAPDSAFRMPHSAFLGPMYLADATRASVWADLGLLLLVIVLIDIALGGLLGFLVSLVEGTDKRVVQAVALPFRGAAWVALVVMVVHRRGQTVASVGITKGRPAVDLPLGLLALVGAFAAFFAGVLALALFWPDGYASMEHNADSIAQMLPHMHPVLLVALQFVVGFYEEVIFRGFLLTRLRRALGSAREGYHVGSWAAAVAISSLLFAAPHMIGQQAAATVPIFGLGVVLCVFTIWRKSLLPAIIGHALFNSCQLVWLYYYHPDWA